MTLDNKKGDGEIFGIIIIGLILFAFIGAIGDNEYKSFMRDCESNDLNKDLFEYNYNGTCYRNLKEQIEMNKTNSYSCIKSSINREKLNLYCQNKYLNVNQTLTQI